MGALGYMEGNDRGLGDAFLTLFISLWAKTRILMFFIGIFMGSNAYAIFQFPKVDNQISSRRIDVAASCLRKLLASHHISLLPKAFFLIYSFWGALR